jgi:hypothetical protein
LHIDNWPSCTSSYSPNDDLVLSTFGAPLSVAEASLSLASSMSVAGVIDPSRGRERARRVNVVLVVGWVAHMQGLGPSLVFQYLVVPFRILSALHFCTLVILQCLGNWCLYPTCLNYMKVFVNGETVLTAVSLWFG